MTDLADIALVAHTLDTIDGGPAKYALDLAEALGQRRQVNLLCITREAVGRDPETWSEPSAVFFGLRRLVDGVPHRGHVIVNGYYLWWVPPLVLLARLRRSTVHINPHGCLTRRQQRFSRGRKWLFDFSVGWLARSASSFVVSSEREARDLRARFGGARVAVIGIGVAQPVPTPRPRSAPSAPIQLLSLSRVVPKKRVDVSIEALSILRAEGLPIELRVVGDGPEHLLAKLRQLCKDLKVADAVHFSGWADGDAKRVALSSSDVFVLPSEDENFGIGPVEALSYGVPCVVTGAVDSVSQVPVAVIAVTSPDPREVAHAVRTLITDDYVGRSAGALSAAEAYSWSSIAASWESHLCRSSRFGTSRRRQGRVVEQ